MVHAAPNIEAKNDQAHIGARMKSTTSPHHPAHAIWRERVVVVVDRVVAGREGSNARAALRGKGVISYCASSS